MTLDDFIHVPETGTHVAEASSLGWPPGVFPPVFNVGTEELRLEAFDYSPAREITGVRYRGDRGRHYLVVNS